MTEAGEGTTLVLLNYKRPQNVRQILSSIEEYECITEVMVVHQLSKTQVEHSRSRITIRRLQGFSREAYGCAQRYFYAPFAQNRFVLFSHDDILPSQLRINDMKNALRSVHYHAGPFGRTCDELGYVVGIGRDRRLDAVAGKMTMTYRWLIDGFNQSMEFYLKDLLNTHGRVDDILFSIHNRRVTHTLPKQNKGRIKALPKGEVGVEKSVRHTKQRSAICKTH
jgi:hypothetical protein